MVARGTALIHRPKTVNFRSDACSSVMWNYIYVTLCAVVQRQVDSGARNEYKSI